jgi:pSer/pThr/pTyr-binding forkhead associated (FHA) protein
MRAIDDSPVAAHSSSPAQLKERLEAASRATPFLVYRDGGGNQRLFDLADAPVSVTVGRRPANDVQLGWDLEVSRVHAQLERRGGDWTLSDDGLSRNGTYLNGERIAGRRRLRDGDAMRFGKTVIVYCAPRGESNVTSDQEEMPTSASVSDAQRRVLHALCRPVVLDRFTAPPSNREIAEELHLSVDSVKTHLRALFQVFDVENLPQNQKRARLVEHALRSGVVSPRQL